MLKVDLDETLRSDGLDRLLATVTAQETKFQIHGNGASALRDIRCALRLYGVFAARRVSRGKTRMFRRVL